MFRVQDCSEAHHSAHLAGVRLERTGVQRFSLGFVTKHLRGKPAFQIIGCLRGRLLRRIRSPLVYGNLLRHHMHAEGGVSGGGLTWHGSLNNQPIGAWGKLPSLKGVPCYEVPGRISIRSIRILVRIDDGLSAGGHTATQIMYVHGLDLLRTSSFWQP